MKHGNTVGSLTEIQHARIIGSLLGDGYMSCKTHAYLKICHSIHQKEYVDWKYHILSSFVLTKPKAYKGNGKRVGYRFCTRSMEVFTQYYKDFYVDRKKRVPETLVLTPFSLAIWFMDDGVKNRKSLYLNTQQFSLRDQENLLHMLKRDFGFEGNLNKDKKYLRIRLLQESAQRMKSLIQPLIPTFMRYKLPL